MNPPQVVLVTVSEGTCKDTALIKIKNAFIRFGVVYKTSLLQEFFNSILIISKICALVRQRKSNLLRA